MIKMFTLFNTHNKTGKSIWVLNVLTQQNIMKVGNTIHIGKLVKYAEFE